MSIDTISFTYDVYTLPSAQHRAGLVALLILCEVLANEGKPLPNIENPEPGKYRFIWTQESLRTVSNCFYDAKLAEVTVQKQWKDKALKREETITTAKGKTEKRYVYDRLAPKAPFFIRIGMPEPWIQLWQDALWATIKAIPKARMPFENRLNGQDALNIPALWKEGQSFCKGLAQGKIKTAAISSSLMLGSQVHNAEKVPFNGRIDENFLLHFWPLVMGIYRPEWIDRDGKHQTQGYVLVIPDVIEPALFQTEFQAAIQQLPLEMATYCPRAALISIPQEGALAYGQHLQIARVRAGSSTLYRGSVLGMEVYHLEKQGHNVRMLASHRLKMDRDTLQAYDQLQRTSNSSIFKRQLILNLLAKRHWYSGFEEVFAIQPHELFIGSGKEAKRFSQDVSRKWSQIKQMEGIRMTETNSEDSLEQDMQGIELRVFHFVREYVERKTAIRSGEQKTRYDGKPGSKWTPSEAYRKACEKVCSTTFYSLRSCKSKLDFMRFFSDTLCAVPHNLSRDNYQRIARALVNDDDSWLTVKSLAMLALSKFSYTPEPKPSSEQAVEA